MSSSTEQRMKLDDTVAEILDAGDTEEELRDAFDDAIDSWKTDNPEGASE